MVWQAKSREEAIGRAILDRNIETLLWGRAALINKTGNVLIDNVAGYATLPRIFGLELPLAHK